MVKNNLNLKTVGVWFVKICLFVVPFVPLFIASSLFFPYITGKAFIFRTVVELAFAGWVFLALFFHEYRPKKTLLLYAIGVFILIVTLATIFSVNPIKSFWSNFERMEGLVAYAHLFLYFITASHIFKKDDWYVFLPLFLISGIVENGWVFLQHFGYLASPQGGISRADGTIGNPTYLAAYLIFIAAFAGILWLDAKSVFAKYFYAIMGVITLISIYYTASRGPSLAILAGAFLIVAAYLLFYKSANERVNARNKKIAWLALAAVVLLPLLIYLLKDTSFVQGSEALSRLTSLSFKERTITSRFSIWSMSLHGIKEHPILGWGPEAYPAVFSKYYLPELWLQEPWFDRSHNIVLDWLINAGALGLLSYLGIFAAAFYLLRKNYLNKDESFGSAVGYGALFVAYFMQNLFVFDNIATYICFFTSLAYINSIYAFGGKSTGKDREEAVTMPALHMSYAPIALVGIAVPLLVSLYFINLKPYLANSYLLDALRFNDPSQAEQTFDNFKTALSYGDLGRQEVREQLARFATMIAPLDLKSEFKISVLQRAVEEADKGVTENPHDARSYLFLGAILSQTNLLDQAIAVINKAIEAAPNKQHIYFELADIYIRRNDYKTAIQVLEKSFNLDRSNPFARINLAAVYILSGAQDKADALLLEGFGTINYYDRILAQVYERQNNLPRLLAMAKERVKRVPEETQYRFDLAQRYLQSGQKKNAISTIEEAIKNNPSFTSQGEVLIADIKNKK